MNDYPKRINGIEVPYQKDISELKSMLEDKMPCFTVACIALAHKNDIDSLNILAELLSNKDWCKRRVAVEALGYHQMGHLLSERLIKLLDDESEYVVVETLWTIAIHVIDMPHNKVLGLINSSSEKIRQQAVVTLIGIGNKEDFDLITRVFLNDKSKHVKDKAARFIRECANANNWEKSVSLLKRSTLARHRVWACELIDIYGNDDELEILKEFLSDKDGHVRKKANRIINKKSYLSLLENRSKLKKGDTEMVPF